MPGGRSSISEIAAHANSSENCLGNLSSEVCEGLIVFIYIQIISTDVSPCTSISITISISIAVSISIAAIIDKDNLLTNNTLRIGLVPIWALTDAGIVQQN